MNYFHIKLKGTRVRMTLTDVMVPIIKHYLDCEIEMLSGSYQKLPDGRHHYEMDLTPTKAELFFEFMKKCVENPQVNCLNSVASQ